jgi:anti-anti-sigma factor
VGFDGGIARIAAAQVAPDRVVVRAAGLFDEHSASRLRNTLFPVVCADGINVLLDLGDALRIDPASIGVIASAAWLSRRRGENLAVVTRDPTFAPRLGAVGAGGNVRYEVSVAGWLGR